MLGVTGLPCEGDIWSAQVFLTCVSKPRPSQLNDIRVKYILIHGGSERASKLFLDNTNDEASSLARRGTRANPMPDAVLQIQSLSQGN